MTNAKDFSKSQQQKRVGNVKPASKEVMHSGNCRKKARFIFKGMLAQVMDEYSSKSFRLLAGAMGTIRHLHRLDLPRLTQQQVEACATDMQLLSLVVLTNSIRRESKETISQIQDG